MPYGDIGSVLGNVITAKIEGLDAYITTYETGLDTILELRQTVQEFARKAQAQAVANVSGVAVTYSGGTFIINRQTGKLARSIQVFPDPGGSPLAATVVASANYAAAIEGGSPARDLKPLLMGKTIPFPVRGGAAARKKAISSGQAVPSIRRASTGRIVKNEAISFRKIGPKSKGWIIPAQPARPFMQATAEQIEPAFSAAIQEVFRKHLNGT